MDQTIEVYHLRDKVNEMEKMKCNLKAKIARMENTLNEKGDENKRLHRLVNFYERESAKLLKDNCAKQSSNVRNLISDTIYSSRGANIYYRITSFWPVAADC